MMGISDVCESLGVAGVANMQAAVNIKWKDLPECGVTNCQNLCAKLLT
jgi:hypothetical protein